MGPTPNYRFSIEKNRIITLIESILVSIKDIFARIRQREVLSNTPSPISRLRILVLVDGRYLILNVILGTII